MHRRLERRLEGTALDGPLRSAVLGANATALLHRLRVLGDEEHPDVLHPSRTLLILLDDCGVSDAGALITACGFDSVDARLAPPVRAPGTDGEGAPGIPTPTDAEAGRLDDEAGLLESLVVAEAPVRLVALAERLDHARHLHLRDRAEWEPFHRLAVEVYTPVAVRTHERMARRWSWWCGMFARRFLGADTPGADPATGP